MKPIVVRLSILSVLLILAINGFSQKDPWLGLKLPEPINPLYSRVVGDSVVFFVEHNSRLVRVFNLKKSCWREYHVPSGITSAGATCSMAGRGVAMIGNDSIIIGFSSQRDTLAYLFYEGLPLTGWQYYGAQNDLGWFYTKEKIYVFDGTDGRWHSFPAPAGGSSVYVTAKERCLVFETWTSLDNFKVLTIYNQLTKNFHQIADDYLTIEYLEDGLVFIRNKPGNPDRYYGSFTVKNDYIQKKDSPCILTIAGLSYSFKNEPRYSVLLSGTTDAISDFQYYYIIGFDTRRGYFTRDSLGCIVAGEYTNGPGGGAYSHYGYAVAGMNYYYKGSRYASDIIIYNGLTGSFSTHHLKSHGAYISFNTATNAILVEGHGNKPGDPLFVVPSWEGINPFNGELTDTVIWGKNYYSGYTTYSKYGRNYIAFYAHKSDTCLVLCYNSIFNKIHNCVFVKQNTYTYDFAAGMDYFVLYDSRKPDYKNSVLRYYSALTDALEESAYTGFSDIIPLDEYVVLLYPDIKKTVIYDPVRGGEVAVNAYPMSGNLIKTTRQSVVVYSDNALYAYSRVRNNQATAQYPAGLTSLMGSDKMAFILGYFRLGAYDADSNAFYFKQVEPGDQVRDYWSQGNLAWAVTLKGWMYVYAPDNNQQATGIATPLGSEDPDDLHVSVCPNPCNDHLKLQYMSDGAGVGRISITSVEGIMIRQFEISLVPGGLQEIMIDTRGLQPGIYMLNVVAGSGSKTLRFIRI